MKKKNEKPHINVDFFEDLTGAISKEKPGRTEGIGRRVRKLREEKGLSLDELSKLTGFEIELLANIEADQVQPQLGTAIKLSKALDGAFSRLVSEVGDKLYSVTRKADQKEILRSTTRKGSQQVYTYKSLAPEVKGRHMEALIVQLEENPEKKRSVHDGEEFIYVLSGQVVLDIGEDTYQLEPGDSAYYLSTTPHLIASKSGKATILAVLYEG